MTPNDFDEYLRLAQARGVAAFVLRIPNKVQLQVTFDVKVPEFKGTDPVPGGWKGAPAHLDAAEYSEEKMP